jgi:hypothetical protein
MKPFEAALPQKLFYVEAVVNVITLGPIKTDNINPITSIGNESNTR